MGSDSESRSLPQHHSLARLRQGRTPGWKRETPILRAIGVLFMAALLEGHGYSRLGVPRQRAALPTRAGLQWPEKWCYGGCPADGRVADWCFTSAVPVTGGRSTAGTCAGIKRGGNSCGWPISGTGKARKRGSITATAYGPVRAPAAAVERRGYGNYQLEDSCSGETVRQG